MIVGEWALLLNTLSIGLVGIAIAHVFLGLIWTLFSASFSTIKPKQRKAFLWFFLMSPILLSTMATVLFVLSADKNNWLNKITHWHHTYIFEINSWHGFLLIAILLIIFYQLSKLLYLGFQQSLNLRNLELLANKQVKDKGYCLIDSDNPDAFTAGFFKPKCYITAGLKQQLTPKALNIVLMHEYAHINNKDPLTKQLFSLFAFFYPKYIKKELNNLYQLTLEEIADQKALEKYSSLDVASTIVAIARLQQKYQKNNAFSYFGYDQISTRVKQLVEPYSAKKAPIFSTLVLLLVLSVATTLLIDISHHLIESLFTH